MYSCVSMFIRICNQILLSIALKKLPLLCRIKSNQQCVVISTNAIILESFNVSLYSQMNVTVCLEECIRCQCVFTLKTFIKCCKFLSKVIFSNIFLFCDGEKGVKSVHVDLAKDQVVVESTLTSAQVQSLIERTGKTAVLQGYGGTNGEPETLHHSHHPRPKFSSSDPTLTHRVKTIRIKYLHEIKKKLRA